VPAEVVARAEYWRRHVREPVRFSSGMRALQALGCEAFVEIGPGASLVGLGQRCLPGDAEVWAASMRKGLCERTQLLGAVGALFTRGVQIDWAGLDAGRPRRSLPLPTYPFERQRYWLDTIATPVRSGGQAPLGREAIGDRLYQLAWRATTSSAAPIASSPGRWIILADHGGVGVALGAALEARGAVCSIVDAATPPEEIACAAKGARGIVHLRALDVRTPDQCDVPALARAQSLGCDSALQLTRALLAAEVSCRTWYVTRRSQPVLADGAIEIGQAPLWGFSRALALEHPELWGGLVDVDDEPPSALAVALAGEILGEGGEDQIAYRAGQRYAARLERRPHLGTRAWSLRGDATYLVTGGLGGIGLALSRWLVERGARHLVLNWRTAGAATVAQRTRIAELERAGATVRLVQADASDELAMTALLDELHHASPPLRGVFHAAGVSAPCAIAALDAGGLAGVLAPKIAGAWILHRLTRELPLDHFVCFSSIASVLGSRQLAAYAAGNAFLDALAHHRAALGLPVLCVNWGPWAEVGMTSRAEQALLERIGMHALPTRDALAVLDHLLGSGVPQVMVANIDWDAFVPALEAKARRPILDAVRVREDAVPAELPALRKRLEAAAPETREPLLVAWLRGEVARVLGRDTPLAIDVAQGFFEMGLDSLMAVELKRTLEKALGMTLPRTLAFEFPSVAALAGHLCIACPCACPPTPPAVPTPPVLLDLPVLSEREAEALLLDELQSLEQENRI